MQKKVLLIAGGPWQEPLAKRLKEEGFYVLCSNLYEDSPAFKYADKCLVADVRDIERNYAFAKDEKIDAVVTDESDIAVPTVAYIAERMHIPGITGEKAELFTDKFLMREFCSKNGFPSPGYRLCTSVREALEFLKTTGKIIIKPVDNQASRGVFCVSDEKELNLRFEETAGYSRKERVVAIRT